jgi:hypothetical protein
MDQRDKMFALLGVFLVVISAAGGLVFATGLVDQDGDDERVYVAEWSEVQGRMSSQPGTNSGGFDFTLSEHNITQVTVALMWVDDELVGPIGRRDDLLTLTVEGPPALEDGVATLADTDGEVTLNFDTMAVPTETDPDLIGDLDYTDATGDWSVTVSVEPRGLRDTGNDWTVVISYSYYVGRLVEAPEGS